jgi:outer membrane protein OmpA-like peptidoglycan-associated protein
LKRYSLFFLVLSSVISSAQTKSVVYFNTAESTLLSPARKKLDSLAAFFKAAGRYHLTINGYCDSTGRHPGNITLGKARADAVIAYLKGQGLSADSMESSGYAESNPASKGNDDISLSKNRRVEILTNSRNKNVGKSNAIPAIEKLAIGQKLTLKDLNFENNSAILLPESVHVIRELLQYMLDNPSLEIKLSGHVCCTDDMSLSVARAKFVYQYLVHNDIDEARMTYEGFSNRQPLLPNDEMDAYAAKVNRRVEITIVRK